MLKSGMSFILALLLLLGLGGRSLAQAQTDEGNIPLHVRYCESTRAEMGIAPLLEELTLVDGLLVDLQGFLNEYELGNRTVAEGLTLVELFQSSYSEQARIPCMIPLESSITRTLLELQIAMLYGQLTETSQTTAYLSRIQDRIETLQAENLIAADYLQTAPQIAVRPPDPDPNPEEEVTNGVPGGLPPAPDDSFRNSEELSALMSQFLLDNGVVVLIEASVQALPDNVLVRVQLERFTDANERIYDRENTLFTLDRLGALMAGWPEVERVSRVAIETYDGTLRTFYAESTGANFRAFYLAGSISQAEFEDNLTIQDLSQ